MWLKRVTNSTSIHEDVGPIPDLSQWVKDLVLPRVQHRSQMQSGSYVVAVVWACSCSSDLTPRLGTSICSRCGHKMQKKKKKKKKKESQIFFKKK